MSMAAALLIDFGSTYTKLRAIDLTAPRVLASGQGPSTVTTDVNVGLDAALDGHSAARELVDREGLLVALAVDVLDRHDLFLEEPVVDGVDRVGVAEGRPVVDCEAGETDLAD